MATDPHEQNKYDGEWMDGYFVGVNHRSSEYMVISGEQVCKGPTIRRRVESEAYTRDRLDNSKAYFL